MNILQAAREQGRRDVLEKLAYTNWKAVADAAARRATAAGTKFDPRLHEYISKLEGPVVSIPGFAAAARGKTPLTLERFKDRIDAAAGQGRAIGAQQAANAFEQGAYHQALADHPSQVAAARQNAGRIARVRERLPKWLGGRAIPVPAAPVAPTPLDYASIRANARAVSPTAGRFDTPVAGANQGKRKPAKNFEQNPIAYNASSIHDPSLIASNAATNSARAASTVAAGAASVSPSATPAGTAAAGGSPAPAGTAAAGGSPAPVHGPGTFPAGYVPPTSAKPPQGSWVGRNPWLAAGLAAGGGYLAGQALNDDKDPYRGMGQ